MRRSKATKAVKSLAPRTRKAVATIAQRVMRKTQETKYVTAPITTEGGQPIQIYGSTVPTGGTTQLIPTLPSLAIGPNGFQRIGQSVQPVRHTCTLDVEFNNIVTDLSGNGGLDACAWDVTVHIWYGYARRYKSSQDVELNASSLVNDMFELGNGNSGPFAGAPHDGLKKVNTDVLQVKCKSFRMFRSLGDQNQATVAGGVTTYFPQLIKRRVKLAFVPPKQLKYDENAADPENFAPFFIIGYEHNDNTQASNNATPGAPATILTKPAIQIYGLSELWFKDA